jgi:hypothetical protein
VAANERRTQKAAQMCGRRLLDDLNRGRGANERGEASERGSLRDFEEKESEIRSVTGKLLKIIEGATLDSIYRADND